MNSDISRIAILVDGDNAQPKSLKAILEEVAKYGKATIRRIYGDWTQTNMNGWKDLLNELSFSPMQKFSYTVGKNSTDGALIIDAMDILHDELVNGFCIVSSDSDFTGLAKRIREQGVFVMGIGLKSTPKAFAQSCEVFVFVENLLQPEITEAPVENNVKEAEQASPEEGGVKKVKVPRKGTVAKKKKSSLPTGVVGLINKAFDSVAFDSDEISLASLGAALRRIDPSFDSRSYGFPTLLPFLKSLNMFEIYYREIGGSNHPIVKRKHQA